MKNSVGVSSCSSAAASVPPLRRRRPHDSRVNVTTSTPPGALVLSASSPGHYFVSSLPQSRLVSVFCLPHFFLLYLLFFFRVELHCVLLVSLIRAKSSFNVCSFSLCSLGSRLPPKFLASSLLSFSIVCAFFQC